MGIKQYYDEMTTVRAEVFAATGDESVRPGLGEGLADGRELQRVLVVHVERVVFGLEARLELREGAEAVDRLEGLAHGVEQPGEQLVPGVHLGPLPRGIGSQRSAGLVDRGRVSISTRLARGAEPARQAARGPDVPFPR